MEATYQYINTDLKENILTVTINREDKMNALNITLLKEIKNVVNTAQSNSDIHGIIITGKGTKAFAAGADTVMVGSLLSGTIETPGEVKHGKKLYRGMASKSAQVSWRGGVSEGLAPEGEATQVNCKGTVEQVIGEITGGIKSGMTYLNADQITSIRRNALFMEMSTSGMGESRPHGMNL